jgi:hypothetical protein
MADFPLPTYSFQDVFGTITGPGCAATFGNASGQSDEGITFEQTEDKNRMTPGASGEVMHTLVATDAARLSIHVLKTSPLNTILTQAFNYQKQSSLYWGKNLITITTLLGDVITCSQVAFTKRPANSYSKEPAKLVWEMEVGHLYSNLGLG